MHRANKRRQQEPHHLSRLVTHQIVMKSSRGYQNDPAFGEMGGYQNYPAVGEMGGYQNYPAFGEMGGYQNYTAVGETWIVLVVAETSCRQNRI